MLASEGAISACPVIYQQALKVDSEIRVVACGHTYVAHETVRTSGGTAVDGRLDARKNNLVGRQIDISQDIVEMCKKYLEEMGLAYAAFDFGKVQGKVFFFEANESGQFLYLEHRTPTIPMLDIFCRFLESGRSDFLYEPSHNPIRLSDYDLSDESKRLSEIWQRRRSGSDPTPNELVE
jgi:hypothetical protein